MQINRSQNNSISFSSVIPLKVYIDGMETFGEKNIKAASRQLVKTLTGPIKNKQKETIIAGKLAQKDPDYDFSRAIYGFIKNNKKEKAVPSDFFRVVRDKNNRYYLLTGKHGEHLADLGKTVGNERYATKNQNCPNSFDLHVAKKNYERFIRECINNLKLRLTEFYNHNTKQKGGSTVELNIHMESNKKYGKTNFKMNLADITFTKQNAQPKK